MGDGRGEEHTSDGACGLDLVILEPAVFAAEGHDDDFAEVGDGGEQHPCLAL